MPEGQELKMLKIAGKKVGMTHFFKDDGSLVPLTMIKLYDSCVVNVFESGDNKKALIAFDKIAKSGRVKNPTKGFFQKKSLPIFRILKESKFSTDSKLKIGENLDLASLIRAGDKISISGKSVGKGFAGPMKRWGFRGLEASHGVSVSHRSHGSTGQRQDPGKTFKGKKMAGHMGSESVTIKNIEVVLFDNLNSVIAVRGSVPGFAGAEVVLKIHKNF